MPSDSEQTQPFDGDSEDELDWEEVEVPEQQSLEITIQAPPKLETSTKKKGISHAERLLRIACHKIHTICLLGNAWVRNKWTNDPLLHARLLSLTPLHLQNTFGRIHKSRVPDQNQRGRMFEAAIMNLTEWWSFTFFDVTSGGHIRNRIFDEVQRKLNATGLAVDSVLDLEELQDILEDEGELIRSPKSLMKHALMQSGSRDTSAQLFTALCRALGIPARLVVSLQSMPWLAGVGKPKPTYDRKLNGKGDGKGKEKAGANLQEDDEDEMEEVDIPGSGTPSVSGSEVQGKDQAKVFAGEGQRLDGKSVPTTEKAKGKGKAKPRITLRKTKNNGNSLGSTSRLPSASSSRLASPDPSSTPPVFWTEVFSRPDARWLPVDPIRCIVNKRKVFDPTPSTSAPSAQPASVVYPYAPALSRKLGVKGVKQQNRMVYVLAFEEDGFARDVTRRYAREFGAKVAKVQGGSKTIGASDGRKGRQAWWDQVVGIISRPYRLHRDDLEDEELETAQMMEGMPTTISGFKDHPLYVLTRHLKQTQTIYPSPPATPELGKFRGEPVYPRSSVISLKTAENWMRSEGRIVMEGSQPLKFIKMRAGTVSRMRELELLKDELREAGGPSGESSGQDGQTGGGEPMQGLYARRQTELYVPNPVVDGKIPKNNFGNIDLYVSTMLPKGAMHVPFKGTAKIARKLGFDFAEAVTGFQFKKRRAVPIIGGVVIAEENEAALLEAYWAAERDAEEKARAKREERVIKHWTRLIQGLRIRQRLQEQYATKSDDKQAPKDANGGKEQEGLSKTTADGTTSDGGGGFLVSADDVVQAFHLPKSQYIDPSTPILLRPDIKEPRQDPAIEPPEDLTYDLQTMDVDPDTEEIPPLPVMVNLAPKTMQELAEDAALQRAKKDDKDIAMRTADVEESRPSAPMQTADQPTSGIKTTRLSRPTTRKSSTLQNSSSTKQKSRTPVTRHSSARKRRRDVDEENASDDESHSSPQKRVRTTALSDLPAPTRILRSRTSKTKTQIDEEREQEETFKRVVTG